MQSDDGDSAPPTVDERSAAYRGPAPRLAGDRYRLGERIGSGGMGEVVVARDEQLGRDVAIKRIRSGEPSEHAVNRFLREARIQGRLEHPAIPPVHELGRDDNGLPFFAMKKLAGRTLSAMLRDQPDGAQRKRLLRAFADVCLAVEFAHVNGIVHRDLKPDNIVLGDFGEVYVIDWGVAKIVGTTDDDFGDIRSDEVQTRAGTAIGTPGYMAPEQARGDADVDERADVYSLGCVLGRILDRDPQVAPELDELRRRATAPARDDRIPTARSLGEGVQRYLDGDRDLEQRNRLAEDHYESARSAFAADDRAAAMREAGRALALAPQLAGAGELIGRLMLDPPVATPPEVEAELHAEDVVRLRMRLRYTWTFLGYFSLIPGLVNAGAPWLVIATLAATALAVVSAVTVVLHERLPAWLIAVGNVPILMIVAWMYSPMFIAPGIALALAVTVAGHPMLGRARDYAVIFLALFGGVLVPTIAELAGVVPRTFVITDAGVMIQAVGLAHGGYSTLLMLVYVAVLIAIALFVPYALRGGEHELRRRLFVQSWQLRQLAPDR